MDSSFLAKWADSNLVPAQGRAECAQPDLGSHDPKVALDQREQVTVEGTPWAVWKAGELNRLFQEQGVTGQPGRITAATVRDGERKAGSNA